MAEAETAPALRGLAAVYRATGRMDAADPVLERLVALDGSITNLEDLALIKASLGNLDRAETLYRRSLEMRMDGNSALDIDLKLPGSDNPELARAYDNLAVTEAMLEKYPEAEAHYREALN